MTRTVLLAILVLAVVFLTGCGDKQQRFMVAQPGPSLFESVTPSAAKEVAMAEDIAKKRLAYRRQLQGLQAYYQQTGNVMKLEWVDKELATLASAARYRYIIQAEVAGSRLAASDAIPEADTLYYQAVAIYKKAKKIPLFTSKEKMRLALSQFNKLIKEYPTSDKIGNAAFLAGRIHEFFKDYAIAVLYYKRTFQWDPETAYPVRYRAARILDYKLFERSKALKLYRASLEKESAHTQYAETIQLRIQELTAPPASEKID